MASFKFLNELKTREFENIKLTEDSQFRTLVGFGQLVLGLFGKPYIGIFRVYENDLENEASINRYQPTVTEECHR